MHISSVRKGDRPFLQITNSEMRNAYGSNLSRNVGRWRWNDYLLYREGGCSIIWSGTNKYLKFLAIAKSWQKRHHSKRYQEPPPNVIYKDNPGKLIDSSAGMTTAASRTEARRRNRQDWTATTQQSTKSMCLPQQQEKPGTTTCLFRQCLEAMKNHSIPFSTPPFWRYMEKYTLEVYGKVLSAHALVHLKSN